MEFQYQGTDNTSDISRNLVECGTCGLHTRGGENPTIYTGHPGASSLDEVPVYKASGVDELYAEASGNLEALKAEHPDGDYIVGIVDPEGDSLIGATVRLRAEDGWDEVEATLDVEREFQTPHTNF